MSHSTQNTMRTARAHTWRAAAELVESMAEEFTEKPGEETCHLLAQILREKAETDPTGAA